MAADAERQPHGGKDMIYIIGTIFFIGIVLAGSDGPYFPWPNMAGIVLFAISGLWAIKNH